MQNEIDQLISEYPENYCRLLETAYGENMMSEGGAKAIEQMFSGISLTGKSALDVGFGLGGVAFYLADNYAMQVTGVEINPWMIDEANRRKPTHLQSQLNFITYSPYQGLPFENHSFDIVYSKGVLTHLNDKIALFNEVFRVLKPNGLFIIDDWLSPVQNQWGKRLAALCQAEALTLYAQTPAHYVELLKSAGFIDIKTRDENPNYYAYNLAIIENLQGTKEPTLAQIVQGHQLIADSLKDNELLVRWLHAKRPDLK